MESGGGPSWLPNVRVALSCGIKGSPAISHGLTLGATLFSPKGSFTSQIIDAPLSRSTLPTRRESKSYKAFGRSRILLFPEGQ